MCWEPLFKYNCIEWNISDSEEKFSRSRLPSMLRLRFSTTHGKTIYTLMTRDLKVSNWKILVTKIGRFDSILILDWWINDDELKKIWEFDTVKISSNRWRFRLRHIRVLHLVLGSHTLELEFLSCVFWEARSLLAQSDWTIRSGFLLRIFWANQIGA